MHRPILTKRVTYYEVYSDNVKIIERRLRIELRIYDSDAIGQHRFRFVMIKHDHVHAALPALGTLGNRRSATVDRNQSPPTMSLKTALHAFAAQSITFMHPQRQK